MTYSESTQKRIQTQFNGDVEAFKAYMAANGAKGGAKSHVGGFKDPERARQAQKLSAASRVANRKKNAKAKEL